MSPLGVVPDSVSSSHPVNKEMRTRLYTLYEFHQEFSIPPDPLRDGPVLLALLGEDPLDAESLQGRHSNFVTSAIY